MSIAVRLLCAVSLLVVLPAATAAADHAPGDATGGARMPDPPAIAQAVCEDDRAWSCKRGAKLTLRGESLDEVRQVRFLGRRTRHDDRRARPRRKDAHTVVVRVPRGARSGPVAVVATAGQRARTRRALRVRSARDRQAAAHPGPSADGRFFPVAGPHSYGTYVNSFGGGRGHQGHDVFADCGTPLVAISDAKVLAARYHSRAGNYVVLQRPDGESFAYMHLQAPTPLAQGDAVTAGQQVGLVGDTGRATGCHLHFEQWTAPGWYQGGEAIDPLPLLRSLDR